VLIFVCCNFCFASCVRTTENAAPLVQSVVRRRLTRILYEEGGRLWLASAKGQNLADLLVQVLLSDGGVLHSVAARKRRALQLQKSSQAARATLAADPRGWEAFFSSAWTQASKTNSMWGSMGTRQSEALLTSSYNGSAGASRGKDESTYPHTTTQTQMHSAFAQASVSMTKTYLLQRPLLSASGHDATGTPMIVSPSSTRALTNVMQAPRTAGSPGSALVGMPSARAFTVSGCEEPQTPWRRSRAATMAMIEVASAVKLEAAVRMAMANRALWMVMHEIARRERAARRLQDWYLAVRVRLIGQIVEEAVTEEVERNRAATRIQARLARGPMARKIAGMLRRWKRDHVDEAERWRQWVRERRSIYRSRAHSFGYFVAAATLQAAVRRAVLRVKYCRYHARRVAMTQQELLWEDLRLARALDYTYWRDVAPGSYKERKTLAGPREGRAGFLHKKHNRQLVHWWYPYEQDTPQASPPKNVPSQIRPRRAPEVSPLALPVIRSASAWSAQRKAFSPPRRVVSTINVPPLPTALRESLYCP